MDFPFVCLAAHDSEASSATSNLCPRQSRGTLILGFQAFLTAAAGQADVVKKALAARAEAQRKSWQSSLSAIRAAASNAIDQARADVDAAIGRLTAETEKAQTKLGRVSAAGDKSWQAINSGLEETRSAFERTWKKITDALAKAS